MTQRKLCARPGSGHANAGAYRFVSDLTQSVFPAARISSAGSTPQRNQMHVEGGIDLAAETLQMKLWQAGGSAANDASGIELRVEDGTAYTRRLVGGSGSSPSAAGAWQETPDISGNIAPGGDALAFLSGIKNVTELAPADAPATYRRYAFAIDGPALARYMRDRTEEQLTGQAKLPVGVTLDTPQQYRDAQGEGEVWIDAAGMPLRLAVRIAFPAERDGSHVEGAIRTDFSGFPAPAAPPSFAENPLLWTGAVLGLSTHAGDVAKASAATGRGLLAVAFGAAVLASLAIGRRKRKVYAAAVIAVIASMVVSPLLQSDRAAAFMGEQAARQAQQEQQQQQNARAQVVKTELAGTAFDPHKDPLAQGVAAAAPARQAAVGPQAPDSVTIVTDPPSDVPDCTGQDTTDRDNDGLNNYEECMRGLGTTSDTDKPDHDGDGLVDGLEVYQLGTDVKSDDTDGDLISDKLEVKGYAYGDNTWYLNPLNPDTDGDGTPDSAECPRSSAPIRSASARATPITMGSRTPWTWTATTMACRTARTLRPPPGSTRTGITRPTPKTVR